MAEKVEKIIDDFIEDGNWWLKRVNVQRKSLIDTMDLCKEDEFMFYFLCGEMWKIRKIISNMEKLKYTTKVCNEHIRLYKAMTEKD